MILNSEKSKGLILWHKHNIRFSLFAEGINITQNILDDSFNLGNHIGKNQLESRKEAGRIF